MITVCNAIHFTGPLLALDINILLGEIHVKVGHECEIEFDLVVIYR